ncbi:hypothetical protein [Prevotellamassilia timonensis]
MSKKRYSNNRIRLMVSVIRLTACCFTSLAESFALRRDVIPEHDP